MHSGIWTSMYAELSPEEAIRHLSDLGWKEIELSTEHLDTLINDPRSDARIEGMAALLFDLGMAPWQGHVLLRLDVAAFDAAKRQEDLDIALRWLGPCAALGIRYAVIHPGGTQGYGSLSEYREMRRLNREAFSVLAEGADRVDIRLAVENMADGDRPGRRRFGAHISELRELIEEVGSSRVGICFDSSHANLQRLDLPAVIRECGDLLWATHISDNDGAADRHWMPFQGKIEWVGIVDALEEVGYDGLFNLEIPGERDCPREIRDMKMEYIAGSVRHLLMRT